MRVRRGARSTGLASALRTPRDRVDSGNTDDEFRARAPAARASLGATSERLLLREPRLGDAIDLFEATRHPAFNEHLMWEAPARPRRGRPAHRACHRARACRRLRRLLGHRSRERTLGRAVPLRASRAGDLGRTGPLVAPGLLGRGPRRRGDPPGHRAGLRQVVARRRAGLCQAGAPRLDAPARALAGSNRSASSRVPHESGHARCR